MVALVAGGIIIIMKITFAKFVFITALLL